MIVEIRTYRLKPGTIEDFVAVMRNQAAPLLAAAGLDVVACGRSLVDDDAYLIRAFPSLEEREAQEDAFYSSAVWREGPREAIVSRIESYHTVVIELDKAVVDGMRR